MSVEQLKPYLQTWLNSNFWNTGHESGDLKFHLALKKVFDELGYYIAEEDYEEAITLLASELHPETQKEQIEKSADEYAAKANVISLYLIDIQNS
jgi:FKBP-type peptidyl-prolyl cis-trans isomerase (trigger factor)